MSNTGKFYQTIKAFREELRGLEAEYQSEMQKLEPHKGSAYYEKAESALSKARELTLDELRRVYGKTFEDIFTAMEKEYGSKPMTAPNADQLAMLQVLKMRDSVTREEVRQAVNACTGCAVALEMLKEIAHKNNIYGLIDDSSTPPVAETLRTLRKRTSYLLGADCIDRRKDILREIVSERRTSDYWDRWQIDADPADEADALRVFGLVTDAQAFCAAVNAQE